MKYKQTFTLKDLLFQGYSIKHLYKLWIKLYKKQSKVLTFLKVFQSDTDCRDCVTFSSRPKGTRVESLLNWEFEVRNCQDKIYKRRNLGKRIMDSVWTQVAHCLMEAKPLGGIFQITEDKVEIFAWTVSAFGRQM